MIMLRIIIGVRVGVFGLEKGFCRSELTCSKPLAKRGLK